MYREGSNTHLGSVAVCIVDTGVMALVQPLKATGREGREGTVTSMEDPTSTPARNHGKLSLYVDRDWGHCGDV